MGEMAFFIYHTSHTAEPLLSLMAYTESDRNVRFGTLLQICSSMMLVVLTKLLVLG
jgi:hypothetical protein